LIKPPQLFIEANFFLLPTISEAFGFVLCEASAHELPSLVRIAGGFRGVLAGCESRYRIPPTAKGKQSPGRIL
jgi:glycosyltransferase involved in cell wall biosynthesis